MVQPYFFVESNYFAYLQYVNFINDKPIGRIKYALNKFRQQVGFIIVFWHHLGICQSNDLLK